MLFVNDLYEPGVPHWLVHASANENSIGLADLVFPAFLFIVGVSVPFAIEARRKKGAGMKQLLAHILVRTISLLVIGVLILNGGERINQELTGMGKLVWLFLLYTSIFLIWNKGAGFLHKPLGRKGVLIVLLKTAGFLLLICLIWKFRGGTPEHPTWLRHGWWGILGLIGWGYLAAALTYVLAGRKILYCVLLWLLALLLNIAGLSGLLDFMGQGWLVDILGVWLGGNVPTLTLAGLVVGMLLKREVFAGSGFVSRLALLGLFCLVLGFGLRHWFIFSKIIGTPSWAMVCVGVSMLVLAGLYYIIDIKGKRFWARPFGWTGRNALTTYLAPDMIYFVVWYFGWPLFFYKQPMWVGWVIGGSLLWAVAMLFYARLLAVLHIRLRL